MLRLAPIARTSADAGPLTDALLYEQQALDKSRKVGPYTSAFPGGFARSYMCHAGHSSLFPDHAQVVLPLVQAFLDRRMTSLQPGEH